MLSRRVLFSEEVDCQVDKKDDLVCQVPLLGIRPFGMVESRLQGVVERRNEVCDREEHLHCLEHGAGSGDGQAHSVRLPPPGLLLGPAQVEVVVAVSLVGLLQKGFLGSQLVLLVMEELLLKVLKSHFAFAALRLVVKWHVLLFH